MRNRIIFILFFVAVLAGQPSTPTGLTATPGNAQVTLTWTANSESDLASYKVYGGTGSIADLVFSSKSPGLTTLTYSTECSFVDPDNIPITILGYGKGVINAQ